MVEHEPCGRKFEYNNEEYIRIDGIWFKWVNNNFVVYKKEDLETIYQKQYG